MAKIRDLKPKRTPRDRVVNAIADFTLEKLKHNILGPDYLYWERRIKRHLNNDKTLPDESISIHQNLG